MSTKENVPSSNAASAPATDLRSTIQADGAAPSYAPQRSPRVRTIIQGRGAQRLILFACFVIVIAGLKLAASFITPILLTCFLAILFWPLMAIVQKTRLPNGLGVALVIAVILSVLTGIGVLVGASAKNFIKNSDKYGRILTEQFGGTMEWFNQYAAHFNYSLDVDGLQSLLEPGMIFGQLSATLSGVGAIASNFVYILILLSFLIIEITIIPKKMQELATSEENQTRFGTVAAKVQTYLMVKTGASLLTAGICSIPIFIFGVANAGLWVLLTFVLNFIPTIGSIIAAVPPIALAFLLIGWKQALILLVVYVLTNFTIGNILEPRVLGKTLGISPLFVFVSLVFWGWVLGPVGAFLSTPLTMIVKIMTESTPHFHWVSVMLGSGEAIKAGHNNPEEDIPAMKYVSQKFRIRDDSDHTDESSTDDASTDA